MYDTLCLVLQICRQSLFIVFKEVERVFIVFREIEMSVHSFFLRVFIVFKEIEMYILR